MKINIREKFWEYKIYAYNAIYQNIYQNAIFEMIIKNVMQKLQIEDELQFENKL